MCNCSISNCVLNKEERSTANQQLLLLVHRWTHYEFNDLEYKRWEFFLVAEVVTDKVVFVLLSHELFLELDDLIEGFFLDFVWVDQVRGEVDIYLSINKLVSKCKRFCLVTQHKKSLDLFLPHTAITLHSRYLRKLENVLRRYLYWDTL